jgi:subtilisin family serine protease
VKVAAGQTVDDAIAAFQKNPSVEFAQPNYIYNVATVPNDPLYGQLWPFKNAGQTVNPVVQAGGFLYTTNNPGTPGDDLHIESAWSHITDCSSVVVAVVDSGVNYNQEDLAANMWAGGTAYPLHGYNYVDDNLDPMDLNGHGSHVAGIIGAVGNNATGTTGVCWKASIMAVRVMDASGRGSTANIVQGITFAVNNGAKVINMSLGGGGAFDQLYSDSITAALGADVVVVVAAGNDGVNNDGGSAPTYPCNFTQANIVCVAALDQSFQLATFSNYGSASVDVGAPGTNIVSTWTGTNSTISDTLNSGWFGSSTTGGGWSYSTTVLTSGDSCLVDPGNYPYGIYNNRTDDRAFKAFNVPAGNVAKLQFAFSANVANGDHLRVAYNTGTSLVDPFSGTGVVIADATNLATFPSLIPASLDVTGCMGSICSIGFQLVSGSAPTDRGVVIAGFSINTLALNTTSYNTENGTSMATPEVAGLATMLRAYHPQYTYADVVSAIKAGGRPVASLLGKTTTGKAVDVMSSIAYIHPPAGLTATVQ